jgi:uncharacterized phage-like protein YoqJ
LPFKGQEARWESFDKQMYQKIITKAKSVVYVDSLKNSRYIASTDYDTYYNSKEKYVISIKMQKRNEHIVDSSTEILTLFNGEKGGTYNCIKYAQSQSKEIINLWDKFKNE